jgi:diguanylate cyclase (GGDEF)-like protein/putative nucleotidyltransferase with HDIG domain
MQKQGTVQDKSRKNESTASMFFLNLVSAIGLAIFAYSSYKVVASPFNIQWVLLSLVTILVVSRTDIHIPKLSNTVTLDDTFIYVAALLYGVEPAVVLAGINAAFCSLHYPNRGKVMRFNTAVMSLSVFVSTTTVTHIFDDLKGVSGNFGQLVLAAQTLALIHYIINSGLVNIVQALRRGRDVIKFWRESFLWTSVSYFAGAIAACLVVKLISWVSFFAFIIAVPILAITYLTYKNYLDKVRASISHSEEMADLHLRTIEALAIAIDAKDEVTHDHVRRVQIYATGLAKIFGLSESEIEALKAGALLHDIGKLAVPDYILNKPGKLTTAEFEKMKVHTIVGAEILERVEFPYPVVPIVRHHHERWDGLGYPDGLRGERIPLTARILSVVDCYDSVLEERQYRKEMTPSEAVKLLEENAGRMYDPKIVKAFVEHLPEFEAEIKRQEVGRKDRQTENRLALEPQDNTPVKFAPFETIRNAHREVITLYNIAQTIGTSLDLRDTFAVFSSRLQDIVSYTTCVLYLKAPEEALLNVAHVTGRNAERFKAGKMNVGAGISGWVVENAKAMYNTDPRLDFNALKLETLDNYQTVMAVPLMKGKDIFGALTLYSQDKAAYESDHLRLVEAVAKLASDAIANVLHHRQTEANALSDPLTNLPNARALRQRFEEEVSRSQRYGNKFAVLMMDLDGFKNVNDTLGHPAGDTALKEIGALLLKQIRSFDFLCRYAGDEFVAIVQATHEEAPAVVRRIQQTLDKQEFTCSKLGQHIGASIGYACYGLDGYTLDELLLSADREMYSNKFKRKNIAAASEAKPADTSEIDLTSFRVM